MMQKVTPAGKRVRKASAAPAPRIEWPADQVERRPIADLIPYARNARQHTDAQVSQIAASIREWGWTMPVLVNEAGELIAGHGRVLAAQQLKLATVPTMTARGWSETKIRAYRLADNKLAELSTWDGQLLGLELAELRDLGAAVELAGFSAVELDSLLAPERTPEQEWQGMPRVDQGDMHSFRSIVVHFADQEAVDAFARTIGQAVTDKTRYIWFPQQVRRSVRDDRYVSENESAIPDLHPE